VDDCQCSSITKFKKNKKRKKKQTLDCIQLRKKIKLFTYLPRAMSTWAWTRRVRVSACMLVDFLNAPSIFFAAERPMSASSYLWSFKNASAFRAKSCKKEEILKYKLHHIVRPGQQIHIVKETNSVHAESPNKKPKHNKCLCLSLSLSLSLSLTHTHTHTHTHMGTNEINP